jgi:GAF domain-containing protein
MPARHELRAEDLAELAKACSAAGQPHASYRALEALSHDIIGHRLFTIMRFDPDRSEVERVHSSLPSVYPVGGRKRKKDTAWSDHVLGAMQVFRGDAADDIRAAFDDHATILGLGLGSVLNIPVVADGRCVGTMNLLHRAGWFRPEDDRVGVMLGAYLVPALASRER